MTAECSICHRVREIKGQIGPAGALCCVNCARKYRL